MRVSLDSIEDIQKQRAINDLLNVYYMDTFINTKGYLQKLIDLLYHLEYYKDNKSLFLKKES